MKDRRAEAERWLDRMTEEHPPEFFRALRDLIEERFPRGPGRPTGSGDPEDDDRLERILELLRFGQETDAAEAIRRVAKENPGPSASNTRKRLRRKLPWIEEQLNRPDEREKAEILRLAFEENVEQWDL